MQTANLILIACEILLSAFFYKLIFKRYTAYHKVLRQYLGASVGEQKELKKDLRELRKLIKIPAFLMLMPIALMARQLVPNSEGLLKAIPPVLMASICIFLGKHVINSGTDLLSAGIKKSIIFKASISGFFLALLMLTVVFVISDKEIQQELAKGIADILKKGK